MPNMQFDYIEVASKAPYRIIETPKESKILALDAVFVGVEDMIDCAKNHNSKNGVFVGMDSELYPCFDSSDSAYENRYYRNFVFAKTEDELNLKLKTLRAVPSCGNYRKLTENIHPSLLPIVYWQGDTYHPMLVPVSE